MTNKQLAYTGIILAVIVAVAVGVSALRGKPTKIDGGNVVAGAVGNMLAENYNPYIQQNGGYFSNLDMKIGGLFTAAGTFQVGSTGTALQKIIGTTCNLIASDASQAASTTLPYDCAVTGITSSDNLMAMLATTTLRNGGAASWEITSAKASTTAGFATVMLSNNGPAAAPSASSVGSSTAIFIFR